MKKYYVVMENYENAYSHPIVICKSKEIAYEIMRYRKNPDSNTIWVEEANFIDIEVSPF